MNRPFISDKTFKGSDYTKIRLPKAEYENCVFKDCDFSNGYLDNQNFMECQFIDCNLSNTNIGHTTFNDIRFKYCKMMGLKFEECNDFLMAFGFEECTLNLSTFYGLSLRKQLFSECKLIEVDFTNADLTDAVFAHCDLDRALFNSTNLEKADFLTSYNFSIDPELNRLKEAMFSQEGLLGLLLKYDIRVG